MRIYPIIFLSLFLSIQLYGQDISDAGSLLWDFDAGSAIVSSPSIIDGMVFFGSSSDKFFCLDSKTGKELWQFNTGNRYNTFISSPVIADGKVYLTSFKDRKVYCLNISTGEKIWDFTCGGDIESSPHIAGGKIYFGSWDKKLYCLDALTGQSVWTFETKGNVRSSPFINNNRVYFGSYDKSFYCIDALTGQKLWEYSSGGEIYSTATGNDSSVFFGARDGKIISLDALSGRKNWEFKTGDLITSSPFFTNDRLYFGSYDKKLYCLNTLDGSKIWEFKAGDYIHSSPSVNSGKVYFGCFDKSLYCVDAVTGAKLWTYQTKNLIKSSPSLYDGNIYIGSGDNKLYCLKSSDTGSSSGNSLNGQIYSDILPAPTAPISTSNITGPISESTHTNILELPTENINSEALITNHIIITNYVTNYVTISSSGKGNYKYTIQTGAFLNTDNAERFLSLLIKRGYDAYKSEVNVKKRQYIRIRIGYFQNYDSALSIQRKLIQDGIESVMVKITR